MPWRRRLVGCTSAALGLTFILWTLEWAPAYWVALQFLYRPVPLADSRIVANLPYDVSSPADPKRQLDLYLPPTRGFPTVVFVHGGGWTSGDRALTVAGADVYGNIGRFLAARGFGTAVISYRLLWDVDWRTQAGDVALAVAWVQREIQKYGGLAGAVFVMGHSAGAQLAMRMAVDPEWLTRSGGIPAGICGAVMASGAGYDMADADTYRLGGDPAYYGNRFGSGAPDGPWRLDASPAAALDAADPPMLVADAEGDSPALRRQAELVAGRAALLGIPVAHARIPGSSHERVVLQLSRDDQTVGPAVLDFLRATPCPRARATIAAP